MMAASPFPGMDPDLEAPDERPVCHAWPIRVRQTLPVIPVPLLQPDPPVLLDLNAALQTAYGRARYALRLHYEEPPVPPLSPEDVQWAAELIAEAQKNS